MAIGYVPRNVSLPVSPISGVVTDAAVSKPFAITAPGSLHLVVKISAEDVAATGTITAKLQTAIDSGWEDSKTVEIDDDGDFYIKLLAESSGDQTYLPLLGVGRVVITTTNAADEVTVTGVMVLQEQ